MLGAKRPPADGKAAEHARQAHAITRLLLSDVRDVVSELRDSSRFDLGRAIRTLAAQSSALAIHLELPDVLEIEESAQADALLKCDRGVKTIAPGNGLTGMRERFEGFAGRVEFQAGDGRGFEVHGFMPRPRLAS